MKWQLRWMATALFCAALTASAGCQGESKVNVKGKLLKDGQPFTVGKDTLVVINFKAAIDDPIAPIHPAKFTRATGGYTVELPPGNYQLFYSIVQSGRDPISAPAEATEKVYELTKSQELDLEIK